MTGLGKLGQEHRRLVDEGLIKTIGHAQRREKALDAYALACVDAALADEWKLLDGPEFDYKKLTAEQENLYAYAFNTGSKQAWEQAKVEHKAALSDTLGLLEELAKLQDSVVIYLHDGQTALEVWQHKGPGMEFRYQKQGRITPCHEENISRAEAEALLGDHADADA